VPALAALQARTGALVAIDGYGPSATVADALQLAQLPQLHVMGSSDVATAKALFDDDLGARLLQVWPHPDLDAAVAVAVPRPIGDAGAAWSRTKSAGNIAPLVALCAARWALARHPGAPVSPVAEAG
jgi:hypothetical protein